MSTTKNYIYNFDEILERLRDISGKSKQYEIAALLGFDKDTFAARKSRGSVPVREIKLACVSNGWSPDWVLTGEGDRIAAVNPKYIQYSSESSAASAESSAAAMLPNPDRMTIEEKLNWVGLKTKDIRQLQEWMKLSEEEQDAELKRLCMQNIEKGRY